MILSFSMSRINCFTPFLPFLWMLTSLQKGTWKRSFWNCICSYLEKCSMCSKTTNGRTIKGWRSKDIISQRSIHWNVRKKRKTSILTHHLFVRKIRPHPNICRLLGVCASPEKPGFIPSSLHFFSDILPINSVHCDRIFDWKSLGYDINGKALNRPRSCNSNSIRCDQVLHTDLFIIISSLSLFILKLFSLVEWLIFTVRTWFIVTWQQEIYW